MNRKILKIITIFTLMMICMGITKKLTVFAEDQKTTPPAAVNAWSINNIDGFDSAAPSQNITTTTGRIMGTIINTIRIVGTGVAIIMIMYVAIKYMSAAPTEKAEFKKSATAYIVGAVVLFASSNILKVIADFATSNIF